MLIILAEKNFITLLKTVFDRIISQKIFDNKFWLKRFELGIRKAFKTFFLDCKTTTLSSTISQ